MTDCKWPRDEPKEYNDDPVVKLLIDHIDRLTRENENLRAEVTTLHDELEMMVDREVSRQAGDGDGY